MNLTLRILSTFVILALFAGNGLAQTPPLPNEQVLAAQKSRIDAIAKATRSTVGVFGTDGQGGGSGVIISQDGYVLTNFHVSSPFGNRMRCGLSDGDMLEAVIVATDPTGDLALLKMFGRENYPMATIANSDTVEVGQWCFAAGNPFVLATNLMPTVTWGIVSGVRRYQYPAGTILEYSDCIQTDASINPGNSGGPLYNAQGDLIGINGRCSFEKRGRVNVGVGYAISMNQAMNFLGVLRSGRWLDHATLGFTVATDPEGKVVVSNILESSDAFRRGIRYGDQLLSVSDRNIANVNQLKNIIGIFPSGWRIPVSVKQADRTLETLVRLKRLHSDEELREIINGEQKREMPLEKKGGKKAPKPGEEEPTPIPEKGKSTPVDRKKDADEKSDKDPLADRLEIRDGFTNYYFNRLELDRILQLQLPYRKWKETKSVWGLRGKIAGEPTAAALSNSAQQIQLKLGDAEETVSRDRGWAAAIEKQRQVCLGVGLAVWRDWHRVGPRALGDAIYLGQAPLQGKRPLVDQTELTIGEVRSVVYSSPEDGRILLIELFGDSDYDPAEIYFEQERVKDEFHFPSRVRLQFGTESVLWVDFSELFFPESDAE